METIFKFRNAKESSPKAQAIGEELMNLKQGALLIPSAVVDAARPEGSILHPEFEWDDSKAAEEHRKAQARQLICSITVVSSPGVDLKIPTRAFVSVSRDDEAPPPRMYISALDMMKSPDYQEQIKAMALRDLRMILRRYQSAAEFLDLAGLEMMTKELEEQLTPLEELDLRKVA